MKEVTALELVNEWGALHRHDSVVTFEKPDATVGLQLINMAIDTVLNDEDWDFTQKHDGVLYTSARATGFAVTDTAVPPLNPSGGDVALGAAAEDIMIGPDTALAEQPWQAPWVHLSGDSILDEASYKVYSVFNTDLFPPTVVNVKLDQFDVVGSGWRGAVHTTGNTDLAYQAFAHEYTLPSYMRSVTGVRHPASDVGFTAIKDSIATQTLVPNPADQFSDQPEQVWAGGTTTRMAAGVVPFSEEPPLLRMVIYPTPESVYKLDFSYHYRVPQLVEPTDTITIPTSAKSKVVMWAYQESNLTQVGNDPKMGREGKQELRGEIRAAKRANEPARAAGIGLRPYQKESTGYGSTFRQPIRSIDGVP